MRITVENIYGIFPKGYKEVYNLPGNVEKIGLYEENYYTERPYRLVTEPNASAEIRRVQAIIYDKYRMEGFVNSTQSVELLKYGKITIEDMKKWDLLIKIIEHTYLMDANVLHLADIDGNHRIEQHDADLLASAIAHYVDVNGDGFVNDLDIDAVKNAQKTSVPTYGKEYATIEYHYNADKGDNKAHAYAEAAQVVRDAAFATEPPKVEISPLLLGNREKLADR